MKRAVARSNIKTFVRSKDQQEIKKSKLLHFKESEAYLRLRMDILISYYN